MSIQQITREGALYRSEKGALLDDQALVLQAKLGHSSAFGELYERHRLKIYRSVFRILRNQHDAEDAVQQSFQQAFTNLHRFREDSAFSTWLTRIAINEALMMLRRRRVTTPVCEADSEDCNGTPSVNLADDGPTPEQAFAEKETRAIVIRAISRLRKKLRAVALLRELQGLSNAETARRLGLTLTTVKARTFHARLHLRKHLERNYTARCLDSRNVFENKDGKVVVVRKKGKPQSIAYAGEGCAKGIRIACLVVLSLLCSMPRAFAQATTSGSEDNSASQPRQHLFGDWGGERTSLASKGVTFDFFYVADLQANPVGGLQQTAVGWGRIRGTMDVDFGKLTDWNGLTFHVTGLWQFGGNLGADMGVLANPSGLVSAHTTRLDSFWLQQALFHNRLLLRAGQMAGLDFYGNQEYGASFLIEPLDYAFGNLFTTYEPFNPAGTPGAYLEVIPWRTLYIKSAVMAGNRNPYVQDPTGFHFLIANTPVFLNEIGFTHDAEDLYGQKTHGDRKTYPGIYKFGSAYNAGKFTNAAGIQSSGNYLIYGMANQALYRAENGSNRGLDGLFGFDWSPNDVNRENSQIVAGLRYNGPIPQRPQDGVAFALVYTKIGDAFQDLGVPLGLPVLGSEKAIEANYALQLRPYLLWQPVFQYYWDVGGNSHIPNAAVFGFRVKVDF